MTIKDKPIYKKHNSFVAIKHKNLDSINIARDRILKLYKNTNKINSFSNEHKKILNNIFDDLFEFKKSDNKYKFFL